MSTINSPASQPLTPEELRNLNSVTDVLPSWNSGDVSGVLAYYDDKILWTNVAMEEAYSGKDEVGGYLNQMLTAFPGLSFRVTHKYPRGHRVAERWVISGEHLGPYLGIPSTGRHVEIHGMSIVHLTEGRFLSDRFYFDTSSVLRSMGLFPPSAVFRSAVGKGLLAVMARLSSALPASTDEGDIDESSVNDSATLAPAESASLDVVEAAIAAFNVGSPEQVCGLLSADITIDNKTLAATTRGGDAAVESLMALADGFPDARLTIVQSLVHDNVIACEFRLRGTHSGTFVGIPPTGRAIDLPGISMITVEDGLIADLAIYSDSGMLWRQIGLMPPLSFLDTGAARISLWIAVNRIRVAAVVLVLGIMTALLSNRDRRTR